MGGYIVLCDHNSKWAEKFTDEAINRNIQTVVVESIAEIEDKLTEDGSSIMLVCSLIELREYLKNNTVDEKIFFEKVSVFVISDSNDDNEEIYYIRQGCVDFQWRKRNIFIIVERIRALLNKIEKASSSLERKIFDCFMKGYKSKEIAELLNIDIRCVYNAKYRLQKKMDKSK